MSGSVGSIHPRRDARLARVLEDHEELIADLAFGDERGARREAALVCGGRDPLQILGVEPLEQRYASKFEHPLDLAEARLQAPPSSLRHPRSVTPKSGSRVVIMTQGDEHVVTEIGRRCGRVEFSEPGDGSPQSSVADRIESLDRLRADVSIVRSETAPDHPARLRHVEDGEGIKREILVAPTTLLQEIARNAASGPGTSTPASRERLAARLIARST